MNPNKKQKSLNLSLNYDENSLNAVENSLIP